MFQAASFQREFLVQSGQSDWSRCIPVKPRKKSQKMHFELIPAIRKDGQKVTIQYLSEAKNHCFVFSPKNGLSCSFRWPKTLAGILAFLPCAPSTFGSAPPPVRAEPPTGILLHHQHHPQNHHQRHHHHHQAGPRPEKKAWRRCDRARPVGRGGLLPAVPTPAN